MSVLLVHTFRRTSCSWLRFNIRWVRTFGLLNSYFLLFSVKTKVCIFRHLLKSGAVSLAVKWFLHLPHSSAADDGGTVKIKTFLYEGWTDKIVQSSPKIICCMVLLSSTFSQILEYYTKSQAANCSKRWADSSACFKVYLLWALWGWANMVIHGLCLSLHMTKT